MVIIPQIDGSANKNDKFSSKCAKNRAKNVVCDKKIGNCKLPKLNFILIYVVIKVVDSACLVQKIYNFSIQTKYRLGLVTVGVDVRHTHKVVG